MTSATPDDLPATCPSCGAAVRQSVPWCLQCYASLRPEPEPEPAPQPEPAPEPAPAQAPGRPEVADVDAVAERMLAELRASQAPRARWSLPPSGGARTGAIVALLVALALLFVLVLTVLGGLL